MYATHALTHLSKNGQKWLIWLSHTFCPRLCRSVRTAFTPLNRVLDGNTQQHHHDARLCGTFQPISIRGRPQSAWGRVAPPRVLTYHANDECLSFPLMWMRLSLQSLLLLKPASWAIINSLSNLDPFRLTSLSSSRIHYSLCVQSSAHLFRIFL